MNTLLVIIGSVYVFLAAVFHAYVFFLESVSWKTPRTWKTFGIASQEDADTIAPMALNQGFYNLFLALGAGIGLVFIPINFWLGIGLVLLAAGSMFLAGVVLFISRPKSRVSALLQGLPPLIGLVLLVLSFAL